MHFLKLPARQSLGHKLRVCLVLNIIVNRVDVIQDHPNFLTLTLNYWQILGENIRGIFFCIDVSGMSFICTYTLTNKMIRYTRCFLLQHRMRNTDIP